jgi:methionyl-tRNA formyltransferase
MGVSVHRIDSYLDHGALLAQANVPVLPGDTPKSLMERTRSVDYRLVRDVLMQMADGTVQVLDTQLEGSSVRTIPTRGELRNVRRKVGHHVRPDDFRLAVLAPIRDDS